MRRFQARHVFFVGLIFAPFFSCFEDAEPEVKTAILEPAVVKGVVVDQRTRLPVKGAVISTVPATLDVVTDDEGRFRLAQGLEHDGQYVLIATAPGYGDVQVPVEANPGEVVLVPVSLAKSDVEPVTTVSTAEVR